MRRAQPSRTPARLRALAAAQWPQRTRARRQPRRAQPPWPPRERRRPRGTARAPAPPPPQPRRRRRPTRRRRCTPAGCVARSARLQRLVPRCTHAGATPSQPRARCACHREGMARGRLSAHGCHTACGPAAPAKRTCGASARHSASIWSRWVSIAHKTLRTGCGAHPPGLGTGRARSSSMQGAWRDWQMSYGIWDDHFSRLSCARVRPQGSQPRAHARLRPCRLAGGGGSVREAHRTARSGAACSHGALPSVMHAAHQQPAGAGRGGQARGGQVLRRNLVRQRLHRSLPVFA